MKLLVNAEERGHESRRTVAGSREENVGSEQLVYFIAGQAVVQGKMGLSYSCLA